jgi:hypothetical protein
MQMNIFSLAYDGKQKEQHIVRLKEQNVRVGNNISELKSASYLGRRILSENAGLQFCDESNIVQLAAAKKSSGQSQLASHQENKANPLSKLLAWRFPQEAHAEERMSRKPWEKK